MTPGLEQYLVDLVRRERAEARSFSKSRVGMAADLWRCGVTSWPYYLDEAERAMARASRLQAILGGTKE